MYHYLLLFSFGFAFAALQHDDNESYKLLEYVSHRVARLELLSKNRVRCYQQNGADINKFFLINGTYRNCLHFSAEMLTSSENQKYIEYAVRRLIKYGANPNAKDDKGCSLFQKITRLALINDHLVSALIKYGADVNNTCSIGTITGVTPLMLHALCVNPINNYKDLRAIQILLDNGIDRDARDSNYDTATGYLVHTILHFEHKCNNIPQNYIDYFKECIGILVDKEPTSL